MKNRDFSTFEMLLLQSGGSIAPAILLIFSWIAVSDGDIDDKESEVMQELAAAVSYNGDIRILIALANKRDLASLQLASEFIRHHIAKTQGAELFLIMAIRIAVADGYLLPGENHILQFLADVLNLTKSQFRSIFLECTGRNFPDANDLSNADYWRAMENQYSHAQTSSQRRETKIERFHAILGVELGASKEEIKKAYRKLVQANHPDRFAALGKEAEAVATENFKRIKEAYNYLINA